MAAQFIHYETYGLKSRSKKTHAGGVIAEAERVPTHSKHVAAPKPPKLLFGSKPSEVLAELKQHAQDATDRTGKRKLPKDAKILLAGVVSMPLRTRELIQAHTAYVKGGQKEKPDALRMFDKWQRLTVDFLKIQYGEGLRSAVLHYDEEFVHLHYYAANGLVNGTLNLDGLDVADDAERALGLDRKARNAEGAMRKTARTEALKGLQDAYFASVGLPLGWTRLGTQKPRMSRQEAEREKKASAQLLQAQNKIATLSTEVRQLQERLTSSRNSYAEAIKKLTPEVVALGREVAQLKNRPDLAAEISIEARIKTLEAKLKPKP